MFRKIVFSVLFVFAMTVFFLAWRTYIANQARYWPGIQASKASGLGVRLHQYRVRHGVYPDSLQALVDSGQMTASELSNLSFQTKPLAERQAWIYRKPSRPEDVAIISPAKAITPMGQPERREATITASADGSSWAEGREQYGPGGPGRKTLEPLPPAR